MNFEQFTERSRGFVQAAQTIAVREGHQQLTPEHLLKALLDDEEGLAANLIRNAGGDARAARVQTEAELAKLPKVEGAGAGQIYLARELAKVLDQAQELAKKAGDQFVTAERLLLALAMAKGSGAAKALEAAKRYAPQQLNHADPRELCARAAPADSATAEDQYTR